MGMTLYFVCCVFLYFTYLEPSAFISFLFEMFGVSYGSVLVLSIAKILASTRNKWIFFVLNILINLKFYVLSNLLIFPRILSFLGSLVSFSLLNRSYNFKLLIFTAIIALRGCVSFRVYQRTNSKRMALMALSVLAVILIQIGFRFESATFNGYTNENEGGFTAWELTLIDHYFQNIFV